MWVGNFNEIELEELNMKVRRIKLMKMMNTSIYEKKIEEIMDKCKAELNQSYYKHGKARKKYGDTGVGALGTLGNCLIKLIRHRTPNIRVMLLVNCYCVLCLLCRVTTLNRLVLRAPLD